MSDEAWKRLANARNPDATLAALRELQKPERERNVWAKFVVSMMAIGIGLYCHALVAIAWWAWFLTPHGLGSLTMAQAIVLRFAISMLSQKVTYPNRDAHTLSEIATYAFLWAVFTPGCFWLIGYAFVSWMPL